MDQRVTKKIVQYDPEQDEADYVCSVLGKIIDDNLDRFKESNEFKVRPGYSYDKFYLDRVGVGVTVGSHLSPEMSLIGLIHHVMFQDGIYKKILTDEQYESCNKVVKEEPESIWGPDQWCLQPSGLSPDDDYEQLGEIEGLLAKIYNTCILDVHARLKAAGFQIDELDEWHDLIDSELGSWPTDDEVAAYLASVR